MIAHLKGHVLRVGGADVVLSVNGVGYLLNITASARQSLPPVGDVAELHVHTHVREDQLALFGFVSLEELDLFGLLIQVDGVGPKVALAILGAASLAALKQAIVTEDVAPIRRAAGVGQRTAQKVIIDLKPRLAAEAALSIVSPLTPAGVAEGASAQVEEALRGLGFSAQQAREGVAAVEWGASPAPEEALAAAIRALGRR